MVYGQAEGSAGVLVADAAREAPQVGRGNGVAGEVEEGGGHAGLGGGCGG